MSAADRMAVRTPDGQVRSVPRRVGLAMIAQSRATHERRTEPVKATKPRKPTKPVKVAQAGAREAVTVVTAEAPAIEVQPGRVVIEDVTPDTPRETVTVDSANQDEVTALPVEAPAVEAPRGNASRAVWADYAQVHGVTVTDDMRRNDIQSAVAAMLESDRMSRPAFTEYSVDGGRPATPEDEPVTKVVTDADPGTTAV